ncbi:hypothetical protein KJ785_04885 [Patescibacteria group bacterium]|nr:hypothetical protein [Patescibacteria group bacterium]
MSALALAMKKAGHTVTGSDVGIYPPISTYLKESGVDYYTGWHPEKMETPDLAVVGNVAGSTNPEWLYVQENKIPYKSYPEIIAEYFVKENSIVCAGTYGKTSTTALLTWILKQAKLDPTYMFGGISLNDIPAADLTDSLVENPSTKLRTSYSILEGDEYKSARWDERAKFFHYHPTHLLLTSCQWDHADVYPTEESYFDAFKELLKSLPENGLLVASEKIDKDIVTLSHCHIVTYGQSDGVDYKYSNVNSTKDGLEFQIQISTHRASVSSENFKFQIKAQVLGDYMADNMTGAFAMAHQLGIEPEVITKALESFKNIKRRLEKKHDGDVVVFDDIAHSPDKAKSVLETLRHIYFETSKTSEKSFEASNSEPQKSNVLQNIDPSKDSSSPDLVGINRNKLVAIFEPNSGNRQPESIPGYDNVFINADEVIIPCLTRIKSDPNKPAPIDGEKLAEIISKTHDNVKYINDDEELISYLAKNASDGDVIIFLGSHGFRGMIGELVATLSLRGV